MPVVLPPLPFQATPNESQRLHSARPHLIVVHSWGAPVATTQLEATRRFEGVVAFLSNPRTEVSAHVIYGGSLIPKGNRRAVQQVRWERKAWTQAGANSFSYSIESADAIWHGHDDAGLAQLARIVAYMCRRSGIPARWATEVGHTGIARHVDLGRIGNPDGHTDPTTDLGRWSRFVESCRTELERGGFRKSWGRGVWLSP